MVSPVLPCQTYNPSSKTHFLKSVRSFSLLLVKTHTLSHHCQMSGGQRSDLSWQSHLWCLCTCSDQILLVHITASLSVLTELSLSSVWCCTSSAPMLDPVSTFYLFLQTNSFVCINLFGVLVTFVRQVLSIVHRLYVWTVRLKSLFYSHEIIHNLFSRL